MNLTVVPFIYTKEEWLFTTGYPKSRSVGLFDLSDLLYIWDYSLAVFSPVKTFLCGPSGVAAATWHRTIVSTHADLQVLDVVAFSCNRKSVLEPGIELVVSFISLVPMLSHEICKFTKGNGIKHTLTERPSGTFYTNFLPIFLRRGGAIQ